jgi:hypothetical protein
MVKRRSEEMTRVAARATVVPTERETSGDTRTQATCSKRSNCSFRRGKKMAEAVCERSRPRTFQKGWKSKESREDK